MQIETLDSTLNCGAGAEGKAGETRRPIRTQGQHKASGGKLFRMTRVSLLSPLRGRGQLRVFLRGHTRLAQH